MKHTSRTAALCVALSLVIAACGGDDDAGTATAVTTTAPATTAAPATIVAPETTEATATTAPETTAPPATTTAPEDADDGVIGDTMTTMTDEDVAVIEDVMPIVLRVIEAQSATGFYIGISDPVRGDYFGAFGTATTGGPAATIADHFRIGSITKTVTAAATLQLVDEGEIALTDTIADVLPDLAAEYPDAGSVTVEQLLSMRSGIPDYVNVPDGSIAGIVADPARVWSADELVGIGLSAGVDPTGAAGYSTTNYIILQLMVESITGMPLADVYVERITGPLGMTESPLPPDDDTSLLAPGTGGYVGENCLADLAEFGADVSEPIDATEWNASYGQGGGGMTSTIGDLTTWAESELGSSLLSEELTTQRRPVGEPIAGVGLPYGLGLFDYLGWVGHTGEAIGWEALALHNPETGASIAMATNGCGGLYDIMLQLFGEFYPSEPG